MAETDKGESMATKDKKTDTEEKIVPVVEVKDNTEEFIFRKLKVINMMQNPAKAREAAERVLRNRRGIR